MKQNSVGDSSFERVDAGQLVRLVPAGCYKNTAGVEAREDVTKMRWGKGATHGQQPYASSRSRTPTDQMSLACGG